MAQAVSIDCQRRELKTKGFLHQLKRRSMVPGVVYGHGMNPINIAAEAKPLGKVFHTHGTRGLFSLQIEGEPNPLMVVVREVQKNPVSGQLTHIDFLHISMNEKIDRLVGIHVTGEEELLARDITLHMGIQEIEISCLPADLPEAIVLNVAQLEAGDKITVGELTIPAGVEVLTEKESMVASAVKVNEAVEG